MGIALHDNRTALDGNAALGLDGGVLYGQRARLRRPIHCGGIARDIAVFERDILIGIEPLNANGLVNRLKRKIFQRHGDVVIGGVGIQAVAVLVGVDDCAVFHRESHIGRRHRYGVSAVERDGMARQVDGHLGAGLGDVDVLVFARRNLIGAQIAQKGDRAAIFGSRNALFKRGELLAAHLDSVDLDVFGRARVGVFRSSRRGVVDPLTVLFDKSTRASNGVGFVHDRNGALFVHQHGAAVGQNGNGKLGVKRTARNKPGAVFAIDRLCRIGCAGLKRSTRHGNLNLLDRLGIVLLRIALVQCNGSDNLRIAGNSDVDGLLRGVLRNCNARSRRRASAAVGVGLQGADARNLGISRDGELAGANLDARTARDGAAGDGGGAVIRRQVERGSILCNGRDGAARHDEVHAAVALRAIGAKAEDACLNLSAGNFDFRAVFGTVANGADAVRGLDEAALQGDIGARVVVGGVNAVFGNFERAALHNRRSLGSGHNAQGKRATDLVDLEHAAARGVVERKPAAAHYVEGAIIRLDGAAVEVQRNRDAVHATRGHGRVCQNLNRLTISRGRKRLVKRRILDAVHCRRNFARAFKAILAERCCGCALRLNNLNRRVDVFCGKRDCRNAERRR